MKKPCLLFEIVRKRKTDLVLCQTGQTHRILMRSPRKTKLLSASTLTIEGKPQGKNGSQNQEDLQLVKALSQSKEIYIGTLKSKRESKKRRNSI